MKILIWRIFGKSGFLEIDFWFSFTGKENEEWEAELEGELNEFEMVSSKGDAEDGSNDPEWENQIEQMLEAEEKEGKQNWKIYQILCTATYFWMWYLRNFVFCKILQYTYGLFSVLELATNKCFINQK